MFCHGRAILWMLGAAAWSILVVEPAKAEKKGAAPAQQVLALCGESKGTTFFLEGGLVPPGQGGWKEDGLTGGAIVLVLAVAPWTLSSRTQPEPAATAPKAATFT
jgi:hypothetical protein